MRSKAMQILVSFLLLLAAADMDAEPALTIDPWIDGAAAVSGLGAALASEFLPFLVDSALPANPDGSAVPAFDRPFMCPYNGTLAEISNYLQYAAAVSPMILPLVCPDFPWLDTGAVLIEALSWAYAAKNVLKFALPRLRPWAYFSPASVPPKDFEEAWRSFPSGHTTMAFAGASVLLTAAFLAGGEYPALPWIAAGGIALACGTAGLRMASGAHFLSDVACGAALGSAFGVAAVLLHVRQDGKASRDAESSSLRFSVAPDGFDLVYRF